MRRIIVGTAGHVDHGKTTLVKALTGIDTDRLEEEKRRGISIDLGFAHLDLNPDLRVAFVDVPGHERFIRNMLAGVAGIDFVILVIAADESVKPQTREHFDICRLLGVRHGLIALTKSDLVAPELLELTQLDVEEFVAGSFLSGAPIVPVSATTGAGLDRLRAALEKAASRLQVKSAEGYPRLPIDRSFSMKGQGAVVTGTLVSGVIRMHDELELYPTGHRARVRGLQVHSEAVERAQAGERIAVNLMGIDSSQACRGMVLASPETFRVTNRIDCRVDLLPSAPPLKHRAPVHFHAGTAEVEAQVRLLTSMNPIQPDERGLVRLVLAEPMLLLPGDRFIIRRFSPVVTIGGGTVIDIAAPVRLRRPVLAARLEKLAAASPLEQVTLRVEESPFGLALSEAVQRTGLHGDEIRAMAKSDPLERNEIFVVEPQNRILSRAWQLQKLARVRESLAEFHRQNPLQPGISKELLRTREFAAAPPFLMDTLLAGAEGIVVESELVRLKSHRIALKQDEQQAASRMEAMFEQAGFAVPYVTEVLAKSGIQADRARSLLQMLLRERKLARVSTELVFHHTALDRLRNILASHKGRRFSVGEFKEWTGLSRKYAVPLLEFFDRERLTRREGDSRVIC